MTIIPPSDSHSAEVLEIKTCSMTQGAVLRRLSLVSVFWGGVFLLTASGSLGWFGSNMGYLDLLKSIFGTATAENHSKSSHNPYLDRSLDHFQLAASLDGQNESAWIGLVLASSMQGDLKSMYQAASLMPSRKSERDFLKDWFLSQSIKYLSQNEPDLSEGMLLLSLQLLPDVHDYRYSLQYIRIGTSLLNENRTEEARQVFERGLNLSIIGDDQAIIHANLGKIAFDAGDFEQALKHFQMAVAIDPFNELGTRWWIWDNQFHIGYILAQHGKCLQATVAYQSALHAATEETQIQTTQSHLDLLPVSCHIIGAD